MSDKPTHQQFPPIRTFKVTRANPVTGTAMGDEIVEAHRYQVSPAGALIFEQFVWDTYTKAPAQRMPRSIAKGAWLDCDEITKHLEVRPAGTVN